MNAVQLFIIHWTQRIRVYLQIQQTFARPHLPIGTPPTPRQARMDWQVPSMALVTLEDPGIMEVTVQVGPAMKWPLTEWNVAMITIRPAKLIRTPLKHFIADEKATATGVRLDWGDKIKGPKWWWRTRWNNLLARVSSPPDWHELNDLSCLIRLLSDEHRRLPFVQLELWIACASFTSNVTVKRRGRAKERMIQLPELNGAVQKVKIVLKVQLAFAS